MAEAPVAGLLFGPGLPPAGQRCEVTVAEAGLLACLPDGMRHALPAQGSLRRTGFDERGVELAWHDAAGAWALHVLDAAQASALRAALPAGWQVGAAEFAREQRRTGRRRAIGWTALALFLAAPLLALVAFFAFADPLAGLVTARISVKQERALGDASFASMKAGLKLRDEGGQARVVREIGARLVSGSRYIYRFHVVEDKALNAFAMPGGIIVVHSGLIAATDTPEELAGVLAHEVQHVELRHSLKALIKRLGLAASWALATGDVGGGLAGDAAQQMLGLKFSRDAEREADVEGMRALLRAGIDPAGMPRFFAKLAKQGGTPPELLSTHPHSADRQQALERAIAAELARDAGRRFTPLAYPDWPPRD